MLLDHKIQLIINTIAATHGKTVTINMTTDGVGVRLRTEDGNVDIDLTRGFDGIKVVNTNVFSGNFSTAELSAHITDLTAALHISAYLDSIKNEYFA